MISKGAPPGTFGVDVGLLDDDAGSAMGFCDDEGNEVKDSAVSDGAADIAICCPAVTRDTRVRNVDFVSVDETGISP